MIILSGHAENFPAPLHGQAELTTCLTGKIPPHTVKKKAFLKMVYCTKYRETTSNELELVCNKGTALQ